MPPIDPAETTQLHQVLPAITSRADAYDRSGEFPAADFEALARAGAMRWALPRDVGGDDVSPLDLHLLYEQVASASLSTALLLTQRDGAAVTVDSFDNRAFRSEVLPKMTRNELFATVGISQLTTSHQLGPPALTAAKVRGGWKLRGLVPWCSGADQSKYLMVGAVVEDMPGGEQCMLAVPTDLPGVQISPPIELVALRSTHTSSVVCLDAIVPDELLLRGPVPHVLSGRKRSIPLPQAFLAMGLCAGAVRLIHNHGSTRGHTTASAFEQQLGALRDEVIDACRSTAPPAPGNVAQLRGRCNELALRITHSAVAIYKGSGLLRDHPAQRLAREAMFLLVWSCPEPVVDCTVELLSAGH